MIYYTAKIPGIFDISQEKQGFPGIKQKIKSILKLYSILKAYSIQY
jgi:hypothetical protein